MTREPLTRDDVVLILGGVEEAIIVDLLATGATVAELAVALEHVRTDSLAARRQLGGRIAALCEILARCDSPEPEYLGTD
jgi:hypothetical protein